ncbi:MAG: hypothetical protein HOG49_21305 [Candidatus Scalindua sp.]|jgi:hypothetical protein|nr:hypothetical protein [Candidatus Scalindua sp.]
MNTLTKTINFEELSKLLRLDPALSCIHFEHPKVKISNRENLPNQFRTSEPVWDWIRSGLPKSNYYLKLSSDSLIRKLEIKSILRLIPHFSHERLEEMIELSELYQPLEKTKPTIPTTQSTSTNQYLTRGEAATLIISSTEIKIVSVHEHDDGTTMLPCTMEGKRLELSMLIPHPNEIDKFSPVVHNLNKRQLTHLTEKMSDYFSFNKIWLVITKSLRNHNVRLNDINKFKEDLDDIFKTVGETKLYHSQKPVVQESTTPLPTAPMRESLTAREAMAKMLSAEPLSVKISHNHFISENHQDFVMVDKNLKLVSQDESLCASLSSNGMPNHGYFVYEMKLNKHSIKKTNIKKLVATMDDLHKYSIDFNNQHKQERIPHSYVEQAEEVMISFMNELNQSYITDRYKEIKKLYKGHSF